MSWQWSWPTLDQYHQGNEVTHCCDHLQAIVDGKPASLRRITTDRYGRTESELFVDGMNVQQAMAASRYAEIVWK